jgi:hypothetical protein
MEAYNIASTTLPTRHISTAMVPRVILVCREIVTYETIVWERDKHTGDTGQMLDIVSHPSEDAAKRAHVEIVQRCLVEDGDTE